MRRRALLAILGSTALLSLAGCGQARHTAPPAPQFVGGEAGAPGGDAQLWQVTGARVEIDPAEVAADVAPGESLPDDAGWSVADVFGAGDEAWAAFDAALGRRLVPANWAAGVAVMVDGQVVHAAAFGERAVGEPALPTDRFRVASISKTITAITALRLVAGGQLTLDEPIGNRLAMEVSVLARDPDVGGLTLRRLLAHTTGFAKHEGTFFGGGAASCRDALAGALTGSVPPAASYRYSNMNYCAAGVLIEALTGKPYEQVVHEQLLEPLGISGMRITATDEVGTDEIDHRPSPGRNFMETLGAAGAWNATPADIVTIVNSIDPATAGPKALPADLLVEMQPHGVGQYGLGLIGYPGGFGHTGTIQNAHSMVLAQLNGVTWAVTVAGQYPSESSRLAGIVAGAFAEAFPAGRAAA